MATTIHSKTVTKESVLAFESNSTGIDHVIGDISTSAAFQSIEEVVSDRMNSSINITTSGNYGNRVGIATEGLEMLAKELTTWVVWTDDDMGATIGQPADAVMSVTIDAAFVWKQLMEVVIAVVSVVGNGLILYAISRNPSLQTTTNYGIASLALADLLVGAVGIPCVVVNNFGLPHHFYGCLFMSTLIVLLTQISIFCMLVIALERFLAIRFPVYHRQNFTGEVAATLAGLAWLAGILVGLIPTFGWHLGPYPLHFCLFFLVIDMKYMVYFNFMGFVLIPLVTMFSIYTYIFYVVRKRKSKLVGGTNNASEQNQKVSLARESRTAKRVFVVIVAFAICWLPIHILNTTFIVNNYTNVDLALVFVFMSHANSAINPFLYSYNNRKFKDGLRRALGMKPTSVDVTSHAPSTNAHTPIVN